MRIVVNCRFLTQPITGVQRYALELALKLRDNKTLDVHFYAPRHLLHEDLATSLNVRRIGFLRGHLWEQLELPFYVKKNELLINFCNTAPLLHAKKIITVHDLAFLQPERWHSTTFRRVYSILIPLLLKTTKTIVTVSQTVKNEMCQRLNIDSNRIHVIHSAVTEDFNQFEKVPTDERFLLFVGSMDPRKNLATLIAAFHRKKTQGITLKIVGGKDPNFNFRESIDSTSDIEFLGHVDDATLFQLYSNAIAFVFPSIYEGFGLPPLEAMHRGCPVIGSDIDVLHEIYGKSMLYFDPRSETSIADAIDLMCESEQIRSALIESSKELIEKYTFEASSKKLVDLIKIAME